MVGQIQCVDATAGAAGIDLVVLKQANEAPGGNIVAHQPVSQQRHPAATDGGFAQDVGVVALQTPMDVELNGRFVTLEGPVVMTAAVIETQALVFEQIPGMSQYGAARQVIGLATTQRWNCPTRLLTMSSLTTDEPRRTDTSICSLSKSLT